ncbi:MAG: glycosyltransferase family 4 protein [Candidatus Doudnabacteria bacterium]|nr:glycosyltransferase family 4 protein [Candidatus Doudnabacteria bacterium]
MRIGIDYRMAGTQNGGIGRYVLELFKNLLRVDKNNEYYFFYNDYRFIEPLKIKIEGFKINFIETNIQHYSLLEQVKFPFILGKYNLDLVHFPNFNAPIFYKRPFVVTVHDLIHHKLGGVKKTNLLHFSAYKTVIKQAILRARKIITVSNASKADILQEYPQTAEKIRVVYEAASSFLKPSPRQVADFKSKFYLDKPYFLFVGVLQRNKNLELLCRAFDLFLEDFRLNFDLVIAGKADPHYPEIKNQCLKIKNRNRLVFTGSLEEDDLSAAYAGAYAFVSASKFEGFGLPGLEAISFGLPLAVSNIPVFNEIYENGAIYFNPESSRDIAQCLSLLAQDRLYYMQLKQKAIARAKVFSWEKCAAETLEVYKSHLQQ